MAVTDPRSRNEQILRATIDGTEYVAPPQSRIEDLLIQLKEAIEQGGGGGGGDVTGVKGSAESTYRKGNVNLTAENIGVEAGAEVNAIESITLNGDTVAPDANKNVALVVITNTVNNLVNYYLKTETYSKSEVDAIAALLKNGRFISVNELPTTDIDQSAIYLVPKSSAQTNNVKDEYINLDGTSAGWEKIGDTQIDLSDYVTTTQLTTALADYTTTTALTALLADKVDKVSGKGLSTNDYDNTAKGIVDGVTNALANKVDKESGKGLSTNDYTSADKAKLESLTRVQYDVMPTASGARVGMVVQYIGATNANYTHNYVYECVDNGGSYAWERKDVQPPSVPNGGTTGQVLAKHSNTDGDVEWKDMSASGGHTIENASGTALTQRDTLQFKGGLSVSDDSTNQKTVVSDVYPEIEYSVWEAMTPQEQEAIPDAIITNVPDTPDVPDGSTVTPTDDVQTLLACAGIDDKSYTTLDELLADTTTLQSVISSENAIDYLVRCKDWCGLPLVPTMTSNTTPSGECFMDGNSSFPAYYAFDGNASTLWATSEQATPTGHIGYKFPTAKTVTKVVFYPDTTNGLSPLTAKLQGSNDGTNYTDLGAFESITQGYHANELVVAPSTYQYFRLETTERQWSGNNKYYCQISELQFYSENLCDNQTFMSYVGLNNYASNTLLADADWLNAICNSTYFEQVLNVKVPTMTSNTTPSGVASASGILSTTYDAWEAFDGDSTTYWHSDVSQPPHSVGYDFGSPKKILMAFMEVSINSYIPKIGVYKIQGSNDGTTWVDLYSDTVANQPYPNGITVMLTTTGEYSKYRVNGLTTYSNTGECTLYTVQFYGREDV